MAARGERHHFSLVHLHAPRTHTHSMLKYPKMSTSKTVPLAPPENFVKWQEFIALNGYRPRQSITEKVAKQSGMTEAQRMEENKLGKWENRTAIKPAYWQNSKQRAEFNKIRDETPTYFQKTHSDLIYKWKDFIALKGYRPRETISKKEAKQSGMTEAQRLEEINLAKTAHWIRQNIQNSEGVDKEWQYPEFQRIEFIKIWDETPTYTQKTQSDKFIEWKNFIAQKGCLPRVSITGIEAKTTRLTKAEQSEETRLGKWASHIERRPLPTAEEQAEFIKLRKKTPTYVQKYGRKLK